MNKVKIFIAALIWTLLGTPLMSQSSISGVVNTYTSIEQLVFREGNEVANAALVSSTAGFKVGDTVMVYQPKGFKVDTDEGVEGRISGYDFLRHVGKYTLLIIHEINLDTIIFNNSTGFDFAPAGPLRQYASGEVGQLIKVASYENAVVNGTLTAGAWDPVTNTGGVLALFVKEKLTLNAPVDVTGKGFKGGDPGSDEYTGLCYSEDPGGLGNFFYVAGDLNKAGLKGEGAADTSFSLIRGKGSLINGGGGGNAKFSGGGGGSNFSPGGAGGNESDLCTSTPGTTNGQSGYALGDDGEGIYTNSEADNGIYVNRIFMGGGGGSGTQNTGNGRPASRGGNGGGIVIIIADTLESTLANPILAKGESVSATVAGSGGGGGGGGCIVLDISHYQGEIKLNAEGGDGGNTSDAVYTGPGGGGGGGIYWVRNDSVNLNHTNTVGQRGKWDNKTTGQAGQGQAAEVLDGLRIPLNGFLFNTLPRDKTVCSDEKPDNINATYPKGGDEDSYVYEWYYRPVSESNWILDGSNTGVGYVFSGPLTETTDYKRTVRSGSLIASDSITYTVLQRIRGNTIMAPDTVCYGLAPVPLVQHADSTLRSANVATDTSFLWIGTTNGTDWFEAPESNDKFYYAPSEIFETTTFVRIARSGVCDDTSNQVVVTVLDAIEDNEISQDTILCYMQTPDELRGTSPGGGDAALFRYKWEVANDVDSVYSEVGTTQHYAPDALDSLTYYYRRIYYSGIQDACKDTTDILTIEVLPFITNNDLITTEDTVCQDAALPVPGVEAKMPKGGREGVYTYIWQVSDDETTWGDSAIMTANDPFNLNAFPAKRYIRRLVKSGMHDVCQDYSDTLVVNVIPGVNNNSLIITDFKECQDIVLPELTANTVTGGDLSYGTLWQVSTDGINFAPAPGDNTQANTYLPGPLLNTSYFRREVWSSADARKVCDTFSDTLTVTIKPRIEENYINGKDLTDSICYNTDLSISGSVESSSPALTGGDDDIEIYSFLWQSSPTLNEADFVGAANTADYSEAAVTALQYLRRIVRRGVCADTSEVLESFVRRLPHGVLALADGQDNIICESDLVPLRMKVDLEGEEDVIDYDIKLTYNSDEGTGTIDADNVITNPGIIEYYPFTDDSSSYVIVLKDIVDNNGCVAPLDSMLGSASVKVYQTPESEIMALDTAVCGPVVSLEAVAGKGGVGHWIQAAGSLNAVFTHPGLETTEVTTDALTQDSEVMKYGWVLETPRCGDTAFVEIVHYKDPAGPPYFQRDTIRMYFATDWMLEADVPTAGGGFWTVADGSYGSVPERSDDPRTLATELELNEANTFVWNVSNPPVLDQDSAVCGIHKDEITIIRNDLQQFDGFSPGNSDGLMLNEKFVMRGLSEADGFTFTVFNNWGTKIKTLSATTEEAFNKLERIEIDRGTNDLETIQEIILWDGTTSDNVTLAPDGAYYYHIRIFADDAEYNKKGYIVLKTRNQ